MQEIEHQKKEKQNEIKKKQKKKKCGLKKCRLCCTSLILGGAAYIKSKEEMRAIKKKKIS